MTVSLGTLRDQVHTLGDTLGERISVTVAGALSAKESVNRVGLAVAELKSDVQTIHHQTLALKDQMQLTTREPKGDAILQAVESQTVLLQSLAERPNPVQSVQPQQDLSKVLSDFDTRLRSFAEVTRANQVSLLQDQEREHGARQARCRNIRIVGLPEDEDVDTQALWKEVDLILLVETWEYTPESRVAFEGFSRVTSVWNKKKQKGRGFGGLTVWSKDGLGIEITVEVLDPRKQFVGLRLHGTRVEESFLMISYFAPWKATVYAHLDEDGDPFLALTKEVLRLGELGPIWVVGDFNARIGDAQSFELEPGFNRSSTHDGWERSSLDLSSNRLSEQFLRFTSVSGLTILNGTSRFNQTRDFTFSAAQGESVVDYLMASIPARERVKTFKLWPLLPESDHRALLFTLDGFSRSNHKRGAVSTTFQLDKNLRAGYEQAIEAKVIMTASSEDLAAALIHTAKKVFPKRRGRRQTWFDEDCVNARALALQGPMENHSLQFRAYRNFARAKKRRWIRERQQLLMEELIVDPASFWKRLRPHRPSVSLLEADLWKYVERLY
ncbi:hypothetical protein R1sor_001270 [Riccia sorocarpa]|uniref:Endonuclease/exonuclease/phosphatase domain-containing protein n=1 Tax=Riccia sorocarpa TaxID=122646 RepID=A0ABD3GVT9_9MARC